MSGGLCRDGVVAVSLGSRGGCRGESTGRPPDGGAPLPASPRGFAASRSLAAPSLLTASGDHAFQVPGPEQVCRARTRSCTALRRAWRSVWAWRRGLGLWAGTPGTSPWAPRGAWPSACAEREPRRVWARGLATVCFLVRRFIRGRGAFSMAGFVRMHAVARRSRCPASAAIGGRAQWRSRCESCVTRWFLSLAPEKTPLFTWLHFHLVKRFSLDPGVKRLR